jgi:iron complex transport system ATP-binding protein
LTASDVPPALLEARDVDVGYNGRLVLKGASAAARPGRVLGIVGPNGSGKTTLLKTMAGLVRPKAGEARLDGEPMAALPRETIARKIALVLPETTIPFDILVEEVAGMGRAPHQRPLQLDSSKDLRMVAEALRRAGASHLRGRDFNGISAGERQRVAIARALAQEPKVLLLDEPTSHLDVAAALEVMALLRTLAAEGMALIAVVHDLSLALRFCDETIVMSEGRCVARGRPETTLTPTLLAKVFHASFLVASVDGTMAIVAKEPSA